MDVKRKQVYELIKRNEQVVKRNKYHLNNIQLCSYQTKEHTLVLHDHYRDLLILLSSIGPNDINALNRAAAATKGGLDIMNDTFIKNFGVTPDQYRIFKVKMHMTTNTGESYSHPNIGVN